MHKNPRGHRWRHGLQGMLSGALLLFLAQTGSSTETTSGYSAATKPIDQKPASTTLLNEWLRSESEAFNPWDIGGDLRTRYELRQDAGSFPQSDFIRNAVNDNDYLELRTKIHLRYKPVDWVNLFVEGRDARNWGDSRPVIPSNDSFDLYQAYFQMGNPKDYPLLLKVGRQEMTYGDERFVGVSDWNNAGRSFDAAKLRFENETLWLDAFVSRPVVIYDEHFNQSNDYETFSGLYASSRKLFPVQDTELFFFSRNAKPEAISSSAPLIPGTPTTARDTYTIGGRVKSLPGKLSGWDYRSEVAGQFGSVSQGGERRELDAFIGDAMIGYTWTNVWGMPRLAAEYTYASGDHDFTDNKYQTFDPLFGTNHKLYGYMDLFGPRNIHNPSVSFIMKPWKGVSFRMDCLAFWVADDHDLLYPESGAGRTLNGYGINPQHDKFIGTELDVLASYQPYAWGELQAGYGHFFTGKYIEQSVESVPVNGGARGADWVYVQAKFTF